VCPGTTIPHTRREHVAPVSGRRTRSRTVSISGARSHGGTKMFGIHTILRGNGPTCFRWVGPFDVRGLVELAGAYFGGEGDPFGCGEYQCWSGRVF
jgi:hypothetical protein